MCGSSELANIVLVGFMGAGKTTVGRALARLTGRRFLDLDAWIVRQAGRSIETIFASEGEDFFRRLETEALASLASEKGMVLATGGGIVVRKENWPLLRSLGKVIYLKTRPETLRERLGDGAGRPLARSGSGWEGVAALLEKRLPLYAQADLVVDTDASPPEEVARSIWRQLEEVVQ